MPIWKGSRNPILIGDNNSITMVINHLRVKPDLPTSDDTLPGMIH